MTNHGPVLRSPMEKLIVEDEVNARVPLQVFKPDPGHVGDVRLRVIRVRHPCFPAAIAGWQGRGLHGAGNAGLTPS